MLSDEGDACKAIKREAEDVWTTEHQWRDKSGVRESAYLSDSIYISLCSSREELNKMQWRDA